MREHLPRNDDGSRQPASSHAGPDGNMGPAGEAGWYLARERVRRGLSLQVVSQAIGVHEHHLRAIETGMLENLPRREEALRMIGAYAEFLGFEPEPLVRHFISHISMREQKMDKGAPERGPAAFSSARIVRFPLVERLRAMSRTPGGISASVLALALVFGGAVWAFWPVGAPEQDTPVQRMAQGQDVTGSRAPGTGQAPKKGKNRMAEAGGPVRQKPSPAVRMAEEELPEVRPEEAPARNDPIGALIARTVTEEPLPEAAPGEVTTASARKVDRNAANHKATPATIAQMAARAAQTAPPSAAATMPPQPARSDLAAPPAASRIGTPPMDSGPALHASTLVPTVEVPQKGLALRATSMIWVRLEDDQGRPWYSGFLRPGQVLKLPDDRMLRLTAGDVHRLEWFVNGQRMGQLGQRGSDFISEPLGRFYQQGGLKTPGASKAG